MLSLSFQFISFRNPYSTMAGYFKVEMPFISLNIIHSVGLMRGLDWENNNELALIEETQLEVQEHDDTTQNPDLMPTCNEVLNLNAQDQDLEDGKFEESQQVPFEQAKTACELLQITYYTQETKISPIEIEDDIQMIFQVSQPLPSKALQFSSQTTEIIQNRLDSISETVPLNLDDENLFLPLSFQEFGYSTQRDN